MSKGEVNKKPAIHDNRRRVYNFNNIYLQFLAFRQDALSYPGQVLIAPAHGQGYGRRNAYGSIRHRLSNRLRTLLRIQPS